MSSTALAAFLRARISSLLPSSRADPATWRFLTGDRAQVDNLLLTGFKVGAPPPAPGREIVHTNRFVLIDPRGQIRWYPRGDEVDVGQVVEEVRRLAA